MRKEFIPEPVSFQKPIRSQSKGINEYGLVATDESQEQSLHKLNKGP